MDQGKKGTAASGSPDECKPEGAPALTFGKMLERFYLNLAPPDPLNPEFVPPVNLKDRGQG